MKYGARNQLTATVTNVKLGEVMSQVDLEVNAPAHMASVLTNDSVNDLKLKQGDKVRVIIKAIHVLIVKE
jgi:molybdate transport system regulatory protein